MLCGDPRLANFMSGGEVCRCVCKVTCRRYNLYKYMSYFLHQRHGTLYY